MGTKQKPEAPQKRTGRTSAPSIDAIADEVCDVSWDGAGLVCKQALKDTLKAAANGPSLAVDDFVRLCESDSEDDLSLYETRYDGEQA